jgi:hypothetical protein
MMHRHGALLRELFGKCLTDSIWERTDPLNPAIHHPPLGAVMSA